MGPELGGDANAFARPKSKWASELPSSWNLHSWGAFPCPTFLHWPLIGSFKLGPWIPPKECFACLSFFPIGAPKRIVLKSLVTSASGVGEIQKGVVYFFLKKWLKKSCTPCPPSFVIPLFFSLKWKQMTLRGLALKPGPLGEVKSPGHQANTFKC